MAEILYATFAKVFFGRKLSYCGQNFATIYSYWNSTDNSFHYSLYLCSQLTIIMYSCNGSESVPSCKSLYLDQYLHHAKRHAKPQNHHSELYAVDRGARLGSANYQIIPSSFIPSQTTKSHNFVLSHKTLAWCICSTQSNFDEEYSTLHLTCVTWKYAMGLVSGSHSFDCSGKTFTEENYHYAYTSF